MRKIVFVSRLDADCSLGAYLLCDISSRLCEIFGDLSIIIVGGGAEYSKIQARAEQINRKNNRRLILLAGYVDDISRYFDGASLFVGVSRAALEAMAHGLPVILLGNEGYLGLLNKDKLKLAEKTNFTCRGAGGINDIYALRQALFEEIRCFFELSDAERTNLGSFSCEVVTNCYSAKEMAQKTENVYQRALIENRRSLDGNRSNPLKIAICGYYGHRNFGDEAILSVLRQKIRSYIPDARVYVMGSKNPIKNINALLGADLFIFGGGSLIQNSTSNASLFYYILTIYAANVLCKRTIMLSNGIGPINDGLFSRRGLLRVVADAVDGFDFISVRDRGSQKLLSSILTHRNINFLPDPALLSAPINSGELKMGANSRYFVYILRAGNIKNSHNEIKMLVNELRNVQNTYGLSTLVVVLNPTEDLLLAKTIGRKLKNSRIICPRSPCQLYSLLSQAKFVISQRYHGALFSCMCGVPTLVISNDPKMQSLCADLNMFPCQEPRILRIPNAICRQIGVILKYENQKTDNESSRVALSAKRAEEGLNKIFENFRKHS